MTRNLKGLGLALFAVLALGAITAQGASAAKAQEFRSDGSWTIGTGEAALSLQVGAVGTVKCTGEFEDQSGGNKVGENEYANDTLTVTPRFTGCTFGGQPAIVFVNHCAFIVDSDLTSGNPTSEEEFANAEIECAAGHKMQVHTTNCTITIGAQTVNHAINYPEDPSVYAVSGNIAAHNIVVGKERNTASQPANGCLLFPTGAVGKLTGAGTTECFRDEGEKVAEKTTPSGTVEGPLTECSVE